MVVRPVISVLLAVLMLSCRREQYHLYNGADFIQFGPPEQYLYNVSRQMMDTAKTYSFAYYAASVVSDTVYFDIYILGAVASVDRPFLLKQVMVPGSKNALPEIQYRSFDASLKTDYIIKAGQTHARVPIIVYRHPSLNNDDVVLQFTVIANNWFLPGETAYTWRRLELSNQLRQPASWDNYAVQLLWGKYSQVKHRFMISQTGERWDQDFMSQFTWQNQSGATLLRNQLKTLLTAYNASHPDFPLTDEDGELVVFP
ncbi:DUF4843 domain-containing protein [Filimonas effusa]|uniref:DUF4843 domain-containing protein n=1 Tax=Filimonas effusa TaxID=2508721 RepID=A0A4Q1D0T2_9BACT|nr:DUF4843 domain-containing protein [Filimonas effusa]RXK80834.1 DUF4843 domain-containing protein [Filimonas effusa]